eukprot:scaffold44905_cov15-Prasinocladus_malaysianus.AAC.1
MRQGPAFRFYIPRSSSSSIKKDPLVPLQSLQARNVFNKPTNALRVAFRDGATTRCHHQLHEHAFSTLKSNTDDGIPLFGCQEVGQAAR